MLINEAGLIRAIKRAYKHGGYTVANHGDAISIYAQTWYIQINRALVTNKVLAAIVEHMGMIPEVGAPTSVMKDEDPQLVLAEVAADDMDHWRSGQRGEEVTMVPVIMQGYQRHIPQPGGAAVRPGRGCEVTLGGKENGKHHPAYSRRDLRHSFGNPDPYGDHQHHCAGP